MTDTLITSVVNTPSEEIVKKSDDNTFTGHNVFASSVDVSGNVVATGSITGSNLSGSNTGDQNLSGLVPYSGATGNVNLGANSLQIATPAVGALYLNSDCSIQFLNWNTNIPYENKWQSSKLSLETNGSKSYLNFDLTDNSEDLVFRLGDLATGTAKFRGNVEVKGFDFEGLGDLIGGALTTDGNITAIGTITGSNLSGTNTGDQTSIKTTITFSKTWNTGGSPYIKTKQVMLANANFVRVYKDNVLLTYETDWTFNLTNGKKIGSVADLTDGVEILSPVDGSVYKVEYDEFVIPISPQIGLYRTDGVAMNKGIIKNTLVVPEGPSGVIKSITDGVNKYIYTVTYDCGVDGDVTRTYYMPDKACCLNYPKDEALPTNWRIELYVQGRSWSGRRGSAAASQVNTMNTTLSPKFTVSTNTVSLDLITSRLRFNKAKLRLRNTVTNEVSLFSIQTIKTRMFAYMSRAYAPIGKFIRVSLD